MEQLSFLPEYFHWIQWKNFCKKDYLNLQPLLWDTKMLPHNQQDMSNRYDP